MLGSEYKQKAMVTANPDATKFLLDKIEACAKAGIELGKGLNAALGLTGEAGEFNDMLKKWIFHDKELDIEHLKRSLVMCVGISLWPVMLSVGTWMKSSRRTSTS